MRMQRSWRSHGNRPETRQPASEGRAFGDYTQYLDKDGEECPYWFCKRISEETEIDELSEESRSIIMGVKVLKDAGACAVDMPPA